MKEFHTPQMVEVAPDDTAIAALFAEAEQHPDRPAISYRDGDTFVDVTLAEFAGNVRKLAAGLISLGIEPGSKIALHSGTRPEFTYFDYAIWAAGCVTVPIYETSSEEQVEWIIGNSEAVAVISETQEMKDKFDTVSDSIPTCEHSIVIEHGGFDHLLEAGASVDQAEVDRRWQSIKQEDLATLVYTSGTTGRPKGCMLSHHNFIFLVRQLVAAIPPAFHPGSSTLFFLPLAHIFARVAQVSCLTAGVKLGYSTGVPQLLEELAMFRPTWLFSVPRVFEKVFNGAQHKAHSEGKGKIFDHAAKVAEEYSRQKQAGRVKLLTNLQHTIFDKLVYSKLRDAFGGQVTYAISGGAALGERLGHFFTGIGVHILEGYGLTETTAGSTLNRPDATEIGSVGPPIPGVTIGIADDGEVLIKGPHVMMGYYKNDAATAESINPDGWFHTGDIGELDAAGFLRITGRKKEILVTAAGKNVAPAVIEDRIRAHALISQAMVIGDGEKFIACLVTIDPDAFGPWCEENGKSGTVAELVGDSDLKAAIQAAIDDGNKAVSRAEAVREFRILPDDFTIDGGEITPTLKLRRAIVMKKYAGMVEEIYR
ncbi:MAG: long-chain fatty acid--CoA ligase [Acidimicrobiia bacterium]|nr:long-chain fatty acid--CoA ligase [Acidimicrobiia bacterium]NNF09356.1 long-chain fatty acid--CoA ligase [Acidimicrobiia bacterium]NNL71205.1 long-chain fatty acid--CoA ligase [Acidimicrobiia bacterium]